MKPDDKSSRSNGSTKVSAKIAVSYFTGRVPRYDTAQRPKDYNIQDEYLKDPFSEIFCMMIYYN